MDLFLGHVSAHFVPGRNTTWLVVFLTAFAGYLTALDRVRPREDARSPGGRSAAAVG
jgi:hypothetical protein